MNTQPTPPPPVPPQQTNNTVPVNCFVYDGQTGQIFRFWILNALLAVITLGIYTFWGKTRMRRYCVSSFTLLEDRFEYTGTGKELFFGFLKALPVIIILYAGFFLLNSFTQDPMLTLLQLPLTLIMVYLIFVATYGAMRYRFSRTTWRGIRGKLAGSAFTFATKKMLYSLLNIVSLGLLIPKTDIALHRYLINNASFGNTRLAFSPEGKHPLTRINNITLALPAIIIMLPVAWVVWLDSSSVAISDEILIMIGFILLIAFVLFFFSRLWYVAALTRYTFDNTTLGTLRFRATHTGLSLLDLAFVNKLISSFTLGLGTAFIIQRKMRYLSRHFFLTGDIDSSGIQQSDETLGSSGEGLDGALGLDSGLM